jgi:hypothetical protein
MANFCIPRTELNKIKEALRKGDISIEKLYDLFEKDPTEMETIFQHYLGEKIGQKVSAEFEKAFISNQKDALLKVVEKTFNPKQKDLRSNFVKRLEKTDKFLNENETENFLNSLVNEKLGMRGVSEEEVSTILEMKKQYEDLQSKIPNDALDTSSESMAYGLAKDDFNIYVGKLKERSTPMTAQEIAKQKLTHPGEILTDIGNLTKSAISTLDNSFFGRQGIKELMSPWTGGTKRWAQGFIQSFKDMGKQIIAKPEGKKFFDKPDDAVMRSIRAEILGSKNARNGKYQAAKNGYGLGVVGEEAFPSTLIERVPGIGRLFKASEVAFNGGALRMRKALADATIERAEKNGIDVMDKEYADPLGELVGSMTGRAELGKLGTHAREINSLLFSLRFLKSNFETLLSPVSLAKAALEGDAGKVYAKKQAAGNLLQIVSTVAAVATIANILQPGSFETNPDSTNFGKLKINGVWHDLTGGMGSIAVLASRMIPDKNGHFWVISSNGKKTELYKGYKPATILSIGEDFILGKLSPIAGIGRDLAEQRDYQGRKPTIQTITTGAVTPFTVQLAEKLKDRSFSDNLLTLILDGIGFGASPSNKKK